MIDPIASLIAIAVVLATPGPTNTLLATAGADAGARRGLPFVAAELLGYAISVTVLRLAGAPVLALLPALGPSLRLVLAGYLLFLGGCLWRRPSGAEPAAVVSPRRILVATLLNPKAAIFAFVLFPDAITGAALAAWCAGFAVVVALCGGLWFAGGRRIRRLGGRAAARLVPRLASVVLAGFAVAIAATTIAAIV